MNINFFKINLWCQSLVKYPKNRNLKRKIASFLMLSFFGCLAIAAVEPTKVNSTSIVFPLDHGEHEKATTETWMFTGEFEIENGEKYAYMYKLKRNQKEYKVFTNIVNISVSNSKPLLNYKATSSTQEVFKKKGKYYWKIKNAFMKYDAIADSWFFGVLDDKNGFNFRVKGIRAYVLNGSKGYITKLHKNNTIEAFKASYSAQSMSINGYLTIENKSNFVTGKNSWFQHSWGVTLPGHRAAKYALITCRFSDNTGLMLYEWFGKEKRWPVNLKTGTYQDALDKKTLLSHFSLAKSSKTQEWTISIPALNINIAGLSDAIPEYDVIQVDSNKKGYCFVNQKGF